MQYTRRLSIRIEGGCHFTARCQGVSGSSFLWTCLWGGCSKIHDVLRLCHSDQGLSAGVGELCKKAPRQASVKNSTSPFDLWALSLAARDRTTTFSNEGNR